MGEYNQKYLELKRRLRILKVLKETDNNLKSTQKEDVLRCVDSLLKELDERYSENLYLNVIELEVRKLEK